MNVQTSVRGTKPGNVFRLCTIVTFLLAFGLTVAAVFSVWRFTAHDASDWNVNHTQLQPAYKAFDDNRQARSILAVRMLTGTTATLKTLKCSSLQGTTSATAQDGAAVTEDVMWKRVSSLATWRGTEAGCLADGTVTKGKCTGNSLSTGTAVNAFPARALNRWRTKDASNQHVFCLLKDQGSTFQVKDADSCVAGLLDCGNHCLKKPNLYTGGCPYGAWTIAKAAPVADAFGSYTTVSVDKWGPGTSGNTWNVHYQKLTSTSNNNAESVGVSVSFYGNECVNPNRFPADPSQQYVLMSSKGTGCGTLGENPVHVVADKQKEWAFLTDNNALLTDGSTGNAQLLPQYQQAVENHQTDMVYLMNHRRILVKPTKACDEFRFDTKGHAKVLLTEFSSIWNLVKWLAIVSSSTSIIAVMMILLVILEGYRKQSQTFMSVLYAVCLVGLFCSVVMVWKARYLVDTNYSKPHNHFKQAVEDKCVSNDAWSKMLQSWFTHTSFGNLSSQLLYTLVLFVAMLLVGVVFAIWALMKLARNSEVGRQSQI